MAMARRERTVAVSRRPKCRVPHCRRDAECRGLCRSCYQSAYQLVSDGVVTWDDLERRGKVESVRTTKAWLLESM